MAAHRKQYNPWADKAAIGRLLKYQAEPVAYEQLLWRQRYGTGKRGCPYCHAIPKLMGLDKRVPTAFPYVCKRCGKAISATLDTPMYHSRTPLPTWFDCMYLFMGGYSTTKEAPISIAASYGIKDIQERYSLTRQAAIALTLDTRDLIYPELSGIWGDEPRDRYNRPKAEEAYERFNRALQIICQPVPPRRPKNKVVDPEKPYIDVEGIARKYQRQCEKCGRTFATDIPDRLYCCRNCRDSAGEAVVNQHKLKAA